MDEDAVLARDQDGSLCAHFSACGIDYSRCSFLGTEPCIRIQYLCRVPLRIYTILVRFKVHITRDYIQSILDSPCTGAGGRYVSTPPLTNASANVIREAFASIMRMRAAPFALATAAHSRPIAPHPKMMMLELKVIFSLLTIWTATESGSISAASSNVIDCGTGFAKSNH